MNRNAICLLLAGIAACGTEKPAKQKRNEIAPTNRVHVPPEVVANLGITFREAKEGRLEIRMEVPGRLEVPADRRWVVRAPAAGRIRWKKQRWASVRAGEHLGELVSDDLRKLQDALYESRNALWSAARQLASARGGMTPRKELAEALADSVVAARGRLEDVARLGPRASKLRDAARARFEEVQRLHADKAISRKEYLAAQSESLAAEAAAYDAQRRVDESRVAISELELRAATVRADVANADNLLAATKNKRKAAELAYAHHLRALATLTGVSEADLARDDAWANVKSIALIAPADGVLLQVHTADGEWVEASSLLAEIEDTSELLFRGELPEGDLGRLRSGAHVRVVSPVGAFQPIETTLRGPLPLANPVTRTVRVEARVPNPGRKLPRGLSATARVLVEQGKHEEVLVPAACIVQDQLEFLLFRRDPENPEYVIRTPVAMGRRTQEWVEVLSGVAVGDEVVANGIHQLKQTSTGRPSATGHFHADGTFHEGED